MFNRIMIRSLITLTAPLLAATLSFPASGDCNEVDILYRPNPMDSDQMGTDIAIGPLGLCVGVPNAFDTPGTVEFYQQDGNAWSHMQTIAPNDGEPGDRFGGSCAVSEDVLVVGAEFHVVNGQDSAGAAYVYRHDGASWQFEQKLIADDAAASDTFGVSVSVLGDVILVGADGDDPAGAAYVFEYNGEMWAQVQKILSSDGAMFDNFGAKVALVDGMAVVSAPYHDAEGQNSGAAYVFQHDGNEFQEQTKLVAWDGAADDECGFGLATDGDRIVLGSINHDLVKDDEGAAYVFVWDGSTWAPEQKLEDPDPQVGNTFGWDVHVDGDRIFVGVVFDTVNEIWGVGSVQLFEHDGTDWNHSETIVASDYAGDSDNLGWSVDASGTHLAAGAPFHDGDDDVGWNYGAGYVFDCGVDLDTDGDGLLDDWEINGIPYTDSSGKEQRYLLDLDNNGESDADPMHKDVFVEVDGMTGLAPANATFNAVSSAFFFAPNDLVDNPDGTAGINLRIQNDESNLPQFGWTLDDTDGDGETDWPTEFDQLKLSASSGTTLSGYFGTVAEREHPDAEAIREAKAKAFRYCIFAHSLDPGDSTSGIAELPGNDFIVTLGEWKTAPGTPDEQAGTFMHELGHTLGLRHGGGDDINQKPNYYSVMNYMWQTPKPWMAPGTWPLSPNRPGYSTFTISPPLDETELLECVPLVTPGSSLAGVWFSFNTIFDPAADPVVAKARMDQPVNWNNNDNNKSCAEPVAADVNRLTPDDEVVPPQTLTGHTDWSTLVYNFRDEATFAPGVHVSDSGQAPPRDLTYEQDVALSVNLPPFCVGDIDDNRTVDIADLLMLLSAWGACDACLEDLDVDGEVGVADLLQLLGAWGPCP